MRVRGAITMAGGAMALVGGAMLAGSVVVYFL